MKTLVVLNYADRELVIHKIDDEIAEDSEKLEDYIIGELDLYLDECEYMVAEELTITGLV